MLLEEQFLQAVTTSKTIAEKPDNETLLKIYALYKQATLGDTSKADAPGAFDFVAKFKHEAWLKLNGTTKEQAMQQYIDVITKLKG